MAMDSSLIISMGAPPIPQSGFSAYHWICLNLERFVSCLRIAPHLSTQLFAIAQIEGGICSVLMPSCPNPSHSLSEAWSNYHKKKKGKNKIK